MPIPSMTASASPLLVTGNLRAAFPNALTLIGCADQVIDHCNDVERSCNATGRETRQACSRRNRVCRASTRCLEGSIPLSTSIDRGGRRVPDCVAFAFRNTGRPGCNPATQDCICARRDYPPVEVRGPRPAGPPSVTPVGRGSSEGRPSVTGLDRRQDGGREERPSVEVRGPDRDVARPADVTPPQRRQPSRKTYDR
jgi:hypothetical protein